MKATEGDLEAGRCRLRARSRWINAAGPTTASWSPGAEQRTSPVIRGPEPSASRSPLAGAADGGAGPVEGLLNALASCVTTGIIAHAAARGIHIEELESELERDIDLRGFLGMGSGEPGGYSNIRTRFRVKADAGDVQRLQSLADSMVTHSIAVTAVRWEIQTESR